MSANISAQGVVTVLGRQLNGPERLTDEDVKDPPTLTRILLTIIRDTSRVIGFWRPRRLDFEGRAILGDGTTKYRLEHQFGGPVRYWIVGWDGAAAANIREHDDSDSNTFVYTSTSAGTATVRLEEAG